VEEAWPLAGAPLAVRLPRRPRRATLQPDGIEVPIAWREPYAEVPVTTARGHVMVVFE
jgi:hypothetical protein